MTDFIIDRVKEVTKLQNSINLRKLGYKGKSAKIYNFFKLSLPVTFLKDICKNILSIENADKQQINILKKLSNTSKCKK